MIEKLEEYGRFLFGWAFRAMQSEMTMQESLNAKSERSYLTGTEIALLEDSSLFIIGIGILVLIEAFFLVAVISLLLLIQYVLESEERTKELPDVLKLPEFMVNRGRRKKHAY